VDDDDDGELFEGGDWGDVSGAARANESPPVEQRLRRAVRATTRKRTGRYGEAT
jgi:hypothetical protein